MHRFDERRTSSPTPDHATEVPAQAGPRCFSWALETALAEAKAGRPSSSPTRLLSDSRGAQVLEYMVTVGVIALLAVYGFRKYASATNDKAESQGRAVLEMAAAGSTPGASAPGASLGDPGGSGGPTGSPLG